MPTAPLASPRRRVRAFPNAKGGNFAVIAALTGAMLILAIGGAVDFGMAFRDRIRAQEALDVAILAAGRSYAAGSTPETILAAARPFFDANMKDAAFSRTALFYDGLTEGGSQGPTLAMHAVVSYRPIFLKFGSAFGLSAQPFDMTVTAHAVVASPSFDVAMVLDTSGSMNWYPDSSNSASVGQRRIDALQASAGNLVRSLRQANATPGAIKVGIVPFSGSVNVGRRFAAASWVDTDGRSPIHHENFDWSTFPSAQPVRETIGSTAVTRWKLNDTWLTRQWLLENTVSQATNTVQVDSCRPVLSAGLCHWQQSMQDGAVVWTLKLVTGITVCSSASNAACWPQTVRVQAGDRLFEDWTGCFEVRPRGLAETDVPPDQGRPETLFVPHFVPDEYDWATNDAWNENVVDYLQDTDTSSILRAQRSMMKYVGSAEAINTWVANGISPKSPNKGCNPNELLPLTDALDTAVDRIDSLTAFGATTIPEGLAWGWRVLSPGPPFTETAGEVSGSVNRVLLLMTDGENTYYDGGDVGKSAYGPYGYAQVYDETGTIASEGRIFDGTQRNGYDWMTYKRAMNDHLDLLCQRIKADGILVATIGLSTGQPSDKPADSGNVSDRLLACASPKPGAPSEKLFFYADSTAALHAAFESVLASLTSLHLSQ